MYVCDMYKSYIAPYIKYGEASASYIACGISTFSLLRLFQETLYALNNLYY